MSGKKARGKRSKTRDMMRRRGKKLSPTKLLKDFPAGSTVQVRINSSHHSGMPFRRFQGLSGKVLGKQGRAFVVSVLLGDQPRKLIVTASHLKELGQPAHQAPAKEAVQETVEAKPKKAASRTSLRELKQERVAE